jgi:hypothetical protein
VPGDAKRLQALQSRIAVCEQVVPRSQRHRLIGGGIGLCKLADGPGSDVPASIWLWTQTEAAFSRLVNTRA